MEQFEEQINAALNWRIEEIAILARLVILNDALTEKQIEVLKKHLIPSFYAYWEGFVKDVCRIYLEKINRLKLSHNQMCPVTGIRLDPIVTKLP
ncbi:MAG: MAE_28990/MAE_18760 family HEPN-like nuclease [Thiotrichaceae bacterium]